MPPYKRSQPRKPVRSPYTTQLRHQKRTNTQLIFVVVIAFIMVYIVYQFGTRDLPPGVVDGEILVHFIDVGQGDSILIQSAHNAVLIDAGDNAAGRAVASYISSMGITEIDYVIATHPHSDHIGGLPAVLDGFNVKNIWMPDVEHTSATFERLLDAIERNNLEWTPAKAGDILSAGVIHMQVVAPNSDNYADLNDWSIVLRMVYGDTAFLFTGDAERISENEMLSRGWNLNADVLKVGHHGSRTSSTEAFLSAVSPRSAVIQSGAGNTYGHPHPEIINRLEGFGVQIFRNDEMGTIVMSTDGTNIYLLGDY